mmetsp:Transcript_21286/g.35650  ORF Transcript_21286/g.35650 Transcript_21286/m.35650 type:complete len:359 (-) Transcript_21286:20-1096(-)|eukprot:CAMPEP_0175008308 /NCGR_PEP_ID=MMETSP0005-20121125/6904_1 /TAXON_ID=420556 /ORGANISM="Ochromonas sp., Strain CCMP1393" /LENGTH=358 /DNA_ID=CAMNT_0016263865 /DNA_START=1 /DNA_END=1077 /DNA_ORIENTATION=-
MVQVILLILCGLLMKSCHSLSSTFHTVCARSTDKLTGKDIACIPEAAWTAAAKEHISSLELLLYPPGGKLKHRMHSVYKHPVYNFLHTYYRYSTRDIKKYSPGISIGLMNTNKKENKEFLNEKFLQASNCSEKPYGWYTISATEDLTGGRYGWINLSRVRDILQATSLKPAFFGCYGLHEWAMLYSGNNRGYIDKDDRHQSGLSLRVSQKDIDNVVSSPGQLRCTHYDAWRFFHRDAQSLNVINPLERTTQSKYEQPGCVHTNMDLFKYAYQLYPLLPSELLVETLQIAITARKIDMRASPYDVSTYEDIGPPICVETAEGRRIYMEEQETLANAAAPVRARLLHEYNTVLHVIMNNT